MNKQVLIVYGKSKNGMFFSYEFYAGEENFQHLAGIKSPSGAEDFWNKCVGKDGRKLQKEDICPVENLKLTSSKIEVLPQALDLMHSKIYKIGEKDLETMYNKFSMGIGNTRSVMGLDERDKNLPIPVTVMNRSINDFCSDLYNIYFVMIKDIGEEKYSDMLYEATKNILSKMELPSTISIKVLPYADEKLTDSSVG
ncbi:MAG: hypothetical protein K2G55_02425 [Lachnospiraceae bacterium]|nr:hypothetical protein [Lachnospiraceae bacterium]